ncbi:IclR family transcriptional regulator [Saccharopolyspora tripterygii]
MTGQPPSLVLKVARLLTELAALGEANATELARATGEPRSSVYRTLRSLATVGWVEESETNGTWQVGIELFRLGAGAVHRLDVRQVARPYLEELHDKTGQTTYLCVRRDMHAVCIERIEGNGVASLALRLGGSLPLHLGASPVVLLAFDGDFHAEWQRRVEAVGLEPPASGRAQTTSDVLERLKDVRRSGFAVSDGDVTRGIAAVGAPVFDHAGRLSASIAVSGLRQHIVGPEQSMTEMTVAAAEAISRSLGFIARPESSSAGMVSHGQEDVKAP